jgi:hypothetical protein
LDVDVLSQERQRYGQREREWEWDRDWEWDREWELVTSMEEIVEPVTVVFDPGNVFKFVVTVDSHWLSLLIIYIVPSGLHQQCSAMLSYIQYLSLLMHTVFGCVCLLCKVLTFVVPPRVTAAHTPAHIWQLRERPRLLLRKCVVNIGDKGH